MAALSSSPCFIVLLILRIPVLLTNKCGSLGEVKWALLDIHIIINGIFIITLWHEEYRFVHLPPVRILHCPLNVMLQTQE